MRFFNICLLVLGIAGYSKESEDKTPDLHDSEDSYVEDFDDFLEPSEEEEAPLDDIKDASLQDLDSTLQEESEDAFEEVLRKAFKTWNAEVKACNGDETCLARVNNVLRPLVNEAADNGVLSVIDPCEDRVGTYEVETVDGWTIEATLPC